MLFSYSRLPNVYENWEKNSRNNETITSANCILSCSSLALSSALSLPNNCFRFWKIYNMYEIYIRKICWISNQIRPCILMLLHTIVGNHLFVLLKIHQIICCSHSYEILNLLKNISTWRYNWKEKRLKKILSKIKLYYGWIETPHFAPTTEQATTRFAIRIHCRTCDVISCLLVSEIYLNWIKWEISYLQTRKELEKN